MRVKVNSPEPPRPRMPDDIGEGNAASPALRCIHPVAGPRIGNRVSAAAVPNVETIKSVECDRQPDPKQLENKYQGKARQKYHLLCISLGSADGGGVRNNNMFEKESANRNDAGKRM